MSPKTSERHQPQAPARGRPRAGAWGWCSLRCGLLSFGEFREAFAAEGLAQLQQAARFDLTDALTGDAVGLGHLFERARLAVLQPEPQLDYLALTRRQRAQHL